MKVGWTKEAPTNLKCANLTFFRFSGCAFTGYCQSPNHSLSRAFRVWTKCRTNMCFILNKTLLFKCVAVSCRALTLDLLIPILLDFNFNTSYLAILELRYCEKTLSSLLRHKLLNKKKKYTCDNVDPVFVAVAVPKTKKKKINF